MKAHLVSSAAVTIVLLTTSHADPPRTGRYSSPVAAEFEAKTGKWKPAGPKPVVPNNPLTPAQRKAQRTPWTWERMAMQPVRFIVMVAKVPLIPAGFLATAAIVGDNRAHGGNMEFPDFGPAFDNFDPGPAIDADLERMHPRTIPKDERAPTPFKSDLRVTRAMPPSSGRTHTSMSIAYNRPAKAPATPTGTLLRRAPRLSPPTRNSRTWICCSSLATGGQPSIPNFP